MRDLLIGLFVVAIVVMPAVIYGFAYEWGKRLYARRINEWAKENSYTIVAKEEKVFLPWNTSIKHFKLLFTVAVYNRLTVLSAEGAEMTRWVAISYFGRIMSVSENDIYWKQ